jgi:hypothetical protein
MNERIGGHVPLRAARPGPLCLYACSARVTNGSCANTRTIPPVDLEQPALAGLKDRMMVPELETRNSRSFRHGSVGIGGCGDRI